MVVPGVVLSAGRSSRMGRPKALLPAGGGENFLSRIVRTLHAGGIADVVVVAAADGPLAELKASVDGLDARIVVNPDPSRGQLSSLVCGLDAIDRPGVDAMLLTLVDVPLVPATTVRSLLDAYTRTHAPIVRPVRAEPVSADARRAHGHPVIVDRTLFNPLRAADPARGAKPVIRAHEPEAVTIPVAHDGPFLDIDTPETYEKVFGSVLE